MHFLTNDEYTAAVDQGDYPADSRVRLGDVFQDERGSISNILLTPITSVARIHSVRGAVRANHIHATDWHYAVVESGALLYFERAPGNVTIPDPVVCTPGRVFFTPPGREHAMLFLEETVIYTFAKNVRSHANHEADLTRVSFVTPEVAAKYLNGYVKAPLGWGK